MVDGPAAIEIEGLSKSFGGVRVLDDVGFDVAPGEIHGLVGRNGSGKSTLIKILSGYHEPDPGGSLRIGGRDIPLPVPLGRSHRLGLAFVHQDLGLAPTLSVLENVRVGRFATGRGGRILWRQERRTVRRDLDRFEVDVSTDARVGDLSTVERVLVALVRAFSELARSDGGVLILDEATASLPRDGVERLFAAVRRAAAAGAGVIFVSHRLDEIAGLTERVSVLRDGRMVGTVVTAEATESELIELIIGHQIDEMQFVEHATSSEPVLEAQGISGQVAQDVSFKLHRGEILGLTGLMGMGHEEIPYLLFGASPASGEIVIGERRMVAGEISPQRMMAAGMALLPADRQGASGVGRLSVGENVTLPVIDEFVSHAFLHHGWERSRVSQLLRAYDVRPPSPSRELETLSGGNQQKALLAKWLQRQPQIFLLHEPTQGIDIHAREEISREIAEIAVEGRSVVMCSSEYDDLARICERVLVFRNGRVVSELRGERLTEERIVEQCYAT